MGVRTGWLTIRAQVQGGEVRSCRDGRKPRFDHCDHHLRLRYAGARHDDRQCLPAAYTRQHGGGAGPDLLGPDVLYRVLGDHDAADGMARRTLRRAADLSRLGCRFHDRLGAVRRRDQPEPARNLSHAAGHLQRRSGAAGSGHAVHDLPARKARAGDGDLQHRRDDGTDYRPHIGRLADRQFRLALVFLYQSPGWRDMRARNFRVCPPVAWFAPGRV